MEIKLLDENLDIFGDPIDDYSSLSYSDKWEEGGSFTAVMSNDHYADVALASYVYFDSRTYEIQKLESTDVLTISGKDLSAMLDRIVIYDVERLQGRLEELARYLVAKYAMSGSQLIAKLVLETDNDFKRAMDVTTERGALGSFLRTALNQRGYSFSLDYDIALDKIVFHVLQSTDRSQDQTANATVMFSTDAGNLEKVTYKRGNEDYRNFAYVCDEDETAPQTVEVDLSNGEPIRAMYVSGKRAGADDSAASNLYVMVGTYSTGVGYIATSTDGQTWVTRVSSVILPCWSVDYQNGKFIVGGVGYVHTSTDGINWTTTLVASGRPIEGVQYFDGMYFAFTSNSALGVQDGEIYASYDALSWSKQYDNANKTINIVDTGNSLIAYSTRAGSVINLRSTDRETWMMRSVSTLDASAITRVYKTIFINGKIIAIGEQGGGTVDSPIVFISSDLGLTETEYAITSLANKNFLDAAYGNGIIVAVGQPNVIAWSADGINWTNCTPAGGTPDYITVTFDGSKFHAYSATTKHHAYSTDGKTWTLASFTTSAVLIDAVVYGTSSHSGNLRQIGIDALQATRTADIIDGEILPDVEPIYGTDYVVGDIADIKDAQRGILASKRIVEVQHIREPNQIVTIPKFGVNFLNLRQYISKEIKTNG